MIIDYSPRQSGKTRRMLVELARNPNAILVVSNANMRVNIGRSVVGMIDIPGRVMDRIFTVEEYRDIPGLASANNDVLVDNAEMILQDLLGGRLHTISISSNDPSNPPLVSASSAGACATTNTTTSNSNAWDRPRYIAGPSFGVDFGPMSMNVFELGEVEALSNSGAKLSSRKSRFDTPY